jgi:uncharacterized protein YecE (DUF72 family)
MLDATAMQARRLFIGTTGWSIPRASAHRFEGEGTHLHRYARILQCAEINSSFHRSHKAKTYERWAASTPPSFRFAVKLPRTITHDQRLRRVRPLVEHFLAESAGLGNKRGPVLVQLPPSLAFDPGTAARFFDLLRKRYDGLVVCEPRHDTWCSPRATALLVRYRVARVAADPSPMPGGALPGGWTGLVYVRLHGSPRKYWSPYTKESIAGLTRALLGTSVDAWCVFDNTASGAALENAWELDTCLRAPSSVLKADQHQADAAWLGISRTLQGY